MFSVFRNRKPDTKPGPGKKLHQQKRGLVTTKDKESSQPEKRQSRDVATWCFCAEEQKPKLFVATRAWKKQVRPRRDRPGPLPSFFRGAPLPVFPLAKKKPIAKQASAWLPIYPSAACSSPPASAEAPEAPPGVSLESIWEFLQKLVQQPPPPPPAPEIHGSPLLLVPVPASNESEEAPAMSHIPEPMEEDFTRLFSEEESEWLTCPPTPDPYREDKGPKQD